MAAITLQILPYGGVNGATVSCISRELVLCQRRGHNFMYIGTDGDSLLPRRRSVALSMFYEQTKADVYVTVDHDISWRGGSVIAIAERALELDAIVGGLYSKRAFGQNFSSRLIPTNDALKIPSDRVIDAQWVCTGFMAIPRCVIRKMLEDPEKAMLQRCWDGKFEYWDFFHTFTLPHPNRPELQEYLSEDWAFCERARRFDIPIKIDLRPVLVHYGEHGYDIGDAFRCLKPLTQAQPNS